MSPGMDAWPRVLPFRAAESANSACRPGCPLWAERAWGTSQGQPAPPRGSISEAGADGGSALVRDYVDSVLASDSWMILE